MPSPEVLVESRVLAARDGMHHGYINEFAVITRDLTLAVDPSFYPEIQGQADSEVLFFLALTLGLEHDHPAVEQAIGRVEAVAESHGVPYPFQGTVATTHGESIWAFRYSRVRNSRSPFYTTDVPTLRERQLLQEFSDDARLIVSEPLGDVAGVWNEVPELPHATSRRTTPSVGHSTQGARRDPCQS